MKTRRSKLRIQLLLSSALFLVASGTNAAGIVASIDKAPVIADGDVTGMPTDLVISLEGSLDHAVDGRTLEVGEQIKVFFPPEFDLGNLNPAYPLTDVPNGGVPCVPTNLQCTTAVILHGWPQQPYFFPNAFHELSIDAGSNALVFTAVQTMQPTGPTSPGIKQLHLILHGVTNPEPGRYRIRVEAQTGPEGNWESGSGVFQVYPKTRPSINLTSVFINAYPACGPGTNPPLNINNPDYQTTAVDSPAPFPWTFLLWGKNNEPLDEVWLNWVTSDHAQLRRGNKVIGHLNIDAPAGASGHAVGQRACPTKIPGAPVIAGTFGPRPVGRIDLEFHTGNVAGKYTTTISLNNGNSVQMVVTAQ